MKENSGIKGYSMERDVRMGFIRKVFVILAVSLFITAGIVSIPMFNLTVQKWMVMGNSAWLLITCIILALIVEIAIFCCSAPARKVPINYICLLTFVLCEGILVAFACASVGYRQNN